MIQYSLKCKNGHRFDSWFQSASAFDDLEGRGLLSCPQCGTSYVSKSLMAPQIPAKRTQDQMPTQPMTSGSDAEIGEMIAKLRKKVEDNADYVGARFATEARAMHDGDVPERAIYGQANAEEAKALVEDGVPVLPLPFTPKQKMQ